MSLNGHSVLRPSVSQEGTANANNPWTRKVDDLFIFECEDHMTIEEMKQLRIRIKDQLEEIGVVNAAVLVVPRGVKLQHVKIGK